MRASVVLSILFALAVTDAHAVSLLTYNVYGLPAPIGGKASSAKWRYSEVGTLIGAYDLVAIQEAWDKRTTDVVLDSKLPYFATGPRPGKLGGGNGLVTLSRFPILESEFLEYSNCIGFDCVARKGVLRTRIQLPDGLKIDVYNTHLNAWFKSPFGDDGIRIRLMQLGELKDFVGRRSVGIPRLVMGDLNADVNSPEHDFVHQQLEMIDVYDQMNGDNPDPDQAQGPTWVPGQNTWIPHWLTGLVRPSRLDHIWLAGASNARIRSARRNLMLIEHQGRNVNLSDHFALEAEIDF